MRLIDADVAIKTTLNTMETFTSLHFTQIQAGFLVTQ